MNEPQPLYPSARRRAGAQPRVLVVDDEPEICLYVRRVLEPEGYAVHEANDGAEALELVRSDPERWDLVLSDIVMPRCNGVELHQQLARLARGMPVILMSGYATPALTGRGIPAPCGVLVKPFEPEELLDEVRRCLPAQS